MSSTDASYLRYERLVHEHSDELYRFAYRLTGKIDAAQDLVQETFLEAWKSLSRQSGEGKERAWLFSILRHRWAHWCRDAGRRIRINGSAEQLDLHASPQVGIVEGLVSEESMQAAINKLETPFREAFLMVFLQGLTCKEAAVELGVPLGTILSRVSRARESLRTSLAEWKFQVKLDGRAEGRKQ
jgi:RNA polymerase sigma-70 factor (ECF subfamily)